MAKQHVTANAVPRKGPLYVALVAVLAGVGIAAYLVSIKLRLQLDPNFHSACNFGDKLNCDAVQTSKWSSVFGIPVALYAVATYLVMAWLAWLGIRSTPSASRLHAPKVARHATYLLGALGLASVGYSIYLAYISSFVLKTYCIYCISMYVVNLAATIGAFMAMRESPGAFLGGIGRTVGSFRSPLLGSLTVGILAFIAAYAGYGTARARMEAAYKAKVDALFAATEADDSSEPAKPVEVASTQSAPTRAKGPVKPLPNRTPIPHIKPKKTENGLTFFVAPIYPDDWAMGPEDAPVTVVKFADFQCSYCRILYYNMKPLEKKYQGKVRWVMKNYPMNADCNPRMGGDRMHEHACDAAYAAYCAGEQGKFWEMHDMLYDNQDHLDKASLRQYAQKIGLDMTKWDACLKSSRPRKKIYRDVQIAGKAYIWGTPRTYVNGRMVAGSASTSILDYYIKKSLEEAKSGKPIAAAPTVSAKLPDANSPTMVKARTAKGEFWIDAFEDSIDKKGRAVSVPGVMPAQVSWFQAKDACEKAGKRLCTEEEWMSACTGEPAIDNNHNGWFNDDELEGRMYPYGAFYEQGVCRDSEDEQRGKPGKTGVLARCRTPDGIYDLTGNLGEWVNLDVNRASLMGGNWRGGEYASCNRRSSSFGPGQRNTTTGFRCCADHYVDQGKVSPKDLAVIKGAGVGDPLPKLELTTLDGKKLTTKDFKGKVTYLTFFASWCGSCKRELPKINEWVDKFGPKGFQIVAVGTDKNPHQSEEFVKKFNPRYPVVTDPNAQIMGKFVIDALPTSYIIDRKGVIRHREVGFKADSVGLLERKIKHFLSLK